MKKYLIIIITIASFGNSFCQSGSYAGSFARLGFGARGLAMGNAMVSDIFGDVSGYYNPSLACFQEKSILNLGYTFMSLDRKLNFVGFAKKFNLPNNQGGAGVSLSWINSGVGNIEGRDNDARQLGMLSTFENQFYFGTGFLVDKDVAIGVGFKLYYAKLYTDVNSSNIAFDIGAIYRAMPNLSIGFSIRDISAKYKWETSKLYGALNGTTTENKFPAIGSLGATYLLPKSIGTVSIGFDTYFNPSFDIKDTSGTITKSDKKYNYILKAGTEIQLTEQLKIRAGIERIDFGSDDFIGNLKPGIGFGFYKVFSKGVTLGLDYSFQLEPFTHDPVQNVGIGFKFN